MARVYRAVSSFRPPDWAKRLPANAIPDSLVSLAQLPTPIHEWSNFPDIPDGFSLSIKRDDLTHATLSGNKVRKLEFLLAKALREKCDVVITLGGVQTNHGRATAIAARELGMDCHLIVRSQQSDVEKINCFPCTGNVLLDRMVDTGIVLAPYGGEETVLMPRAKKLAEELAARGKKPFIIPIGGSNAVGLWGYMTAFQEMMSQGLLENFDDIVLAVGSGGSAAGLAIANYLNGSPLKVHAVCIADDSDLFYGIVERDLKTLLLDTEVSARDIVDIVDGYKGEGYGITSDKVYDFIVSVSGSSGIVLDPTYTGKAVYGMIDMMNTQPERFKGRRVLFIHTGGIFGTYDGKLGDRLAQTSAGHVVDWTGDGFSSCPPMPK